MLASEDSQRGVILSLVSQVSALYFKLLQLDAQLEIAQEAVVAFDKTLDLFTRQYQGGVASRLPVTRAAAAEAQARAWVPEVQIQTALVENQLSVLLGRPPGPIARGAPLIDQQLPEIPPGLPSALLERRPDIQRAEQAVVASNAEIGVAIGNFLPRIGLTALWGGSSDNLSNLATGSANIWSIAAEFSGPIFRAGMLWAEYQARVALWEESKAIYERAALEAFAEVADSLTARSLLGEQRRAFADQSKQLAESVRLSLLRYNQGLASYFEVLQAQQELYPALYNLAETRTAELESVISLYKALGGGWQLGTQLLPEPPAPPEPEEVETILLPLSILRKPETAPSCPPVRLRITPPRCADYFPAPRPHATALPRASYSRSGATTTAENSTQAKPQSARRTPGNQATSHGAAGTGIDCTGLSRLHRRERPSRRKSGSRLGQREHLLHTRQWSQPTTG